MKIFLDTNILISAMVWPNSTPAKAFFKATSYPNIGIICELTVEEMRKTFNKKFPKLIPDIEGFLFDSMFSVIFVPVPLEPCYAEQNIRDPKDRPILRAAINSGADFLLTGDKDFLESDVYPPSIVSASEFLKLE